SASPRHAPTITSAKPIAAQNVFPAPTGSSSTSRRGVEPLHERRAGEDGFGAGQERAALVELVVRVRRVAHTLDLQWAAAACDEQRGHLDEAFLPWAGNLGELSVCRCACRAVCVLRGQVSKDL